MAFRLVSTCQSQASSVTSSKGSRLSTPAASTMARMSPELVGGALDQPGVGIEVVEVHAHGLVRAARQCRDHRSRTSSSRRSTAQTRAPTSAKARGGRLADALGGARHDDAMALQPPARATTIHAPASHRAAQARRPVSSASLPAQGEPR